MRPKLSIKDFYAIESIVHQFNSTLGPDLEAEITKVRNSLIIEKDTLEKSALSKIVSEHTGLSIVFFNRPNLLGAGIYMPSLVNNHTISENYEVRNPTFLNILNEKKYFEGTINLQTVKVTGDYSKIKTYCEVGNLFLSNSSMYTVKEVVAVLLHEIGHWFYYFVIIGKILKTNLLLNEGVKRLANATKVEQKVIILHSLEKEYDITFDDKQLLANQNLNETSYRVLLFNAAVEESKRELDLDIYDARTWEVLADQFCARFGYGRHLATRFDKLYRTQGAREYVSPKTFFFLEVVGPLFGITAGSAFFAVATGLSTLGIGFFVILVMLIKHSPDIPEYDPLDKRILKLKQQVNDALKDTTLAKEQKEKLLLDYKGIEKVLDKMHENKTLIELMYGILTFSGSKTEAIIKFNHDIEALYNNDLFSAAAALSLKTNENV